MSDRKRLADIARAAKKTSPKVLSKTAPAKLRQLGTTWWGHRWIEALERGSRDVVTRLGKGRAYARAGHVHDLQVRPGIVTATVTDDELETYAVSLRLETFDAHVWNSIITAMNAQALYAAQLLNGEMPREIDQLFHQCGKGLFPANSHDIDSDCSCDDWASPCRHVAATHYVLGEALDSDPFLLFTLRGRNKEQVLGTLDQLRGGSHATALSVERTPKTAQPSARGVLLSQLDARRYEHGATPLPVLRFQFDAVLAPGALVNSLGIPAVWEGGKSPHDLLAPVVQAAREKAFCWATGVQQDSVPTRSRGDSARRRQED